VTTLDRRLAAVMFTDMVGYTALLQADERVALDKRAQYWNALERHHDSAGGTIVQRLGDGSMSMFPSSLAAVEAALAIQQELAAQEVRVRIGLHVGDVIVEDERLTGETVNIASRIESFAVPGGVMLSDAAYDQIKNRTELEVVPLGRFRLKNVGRPFELYAVSAEGLVVPEPGALEGKGERFASLPGNVPQPQSPLVGRDEDMASLVELVAEHRVVTITGPGGVGKTRMVAELGRTLAPEFLDGVAFVPFAHVAEAEQVLPALADALDVKEAEGRTLADGLVLLIGDKKALLLLDNLEQVVSCAPDIARLSDRCPELRIVATSRTPLRIAAEREYVLAPLGLPPAVDLFLERAAAIKGPLDLTPSSTAAIAAVCRRLDGLPLALELAAARLRLLSPEALLERLDHALDVLTSGARDAPERQQTLRATIAWSHSLLTESEQRLFRRLALFAGGCTVADAEAVCSEPGEPVLDELESLVDKALVQAGDGGRLRMLETIREYAAEQLESVGESDEIAHRHAQRYGAFARELRDGIEGTGQVRSIERGIADEANLDAALATLSAAAQHGDRNARELGCQMCGDLWLYWHIRGKHLSARAYTDSFLAGDAPTAGRVGALIAAGLASWTLGDYERANDEWAEASRLRDDTTASREACVNAICCAIGLLGFDLDAAGRWMHEAIEKSRASRFEWSEAFALTFEGVVHALKGDAAAAEARYREALPIQRRLGDQEGAGVSLGGLAELAAARGDFAEALDLYTQSLAAFEAIGDRAEEARILSETGWTNLRAGDTAAARRSFFDSVQAYTDIASVRGIGLSLVGLAAAEAAEGRHRNALRVAAAAEVYARQEGIVNVYSEETLGLEYIARARAALAADEADRATETGRRLTIKEALDLAGSPEEAPV
jgi:predicted ATPase/class 3 adenylate cyclase